MLEETLAKDPQDVTSARYFQKLIQELEETGETLFNQLKERMVTLKTSIDSIKEDVQNEKEAWRKEVKETVKWENELRNNKWREYLPPGDYNQQLEMLTTAVLKSQIITQRQKSKEKEIDIFKQKLIEAENLCHIEMLKIKQSMKSLQQLQAMAEDWMLPPDKSLVENHEDIFGTSSDENRIETLYRECLDTNLENSAKLEKFSSESEKDSGIYSDKN